jgi:hypothetical protein
VSRLNFHADAPASAASVNAERIAYFAIQFKNKLGILGASALGLAVAERPTRTAAPPTW